MRVTIKDIAKRAGVTYGTVSRALNGDPRVRAATREKIAELAETMNYIPNLAAKRLTDRLSSCIGFICPQLHGYFISHLCQGLQEEADKREFSLLTSSTDAESALRVLTEHFVDRILLWAVPEWVPTERFYRAVSHVRGQFVVVGGAHIDGVHRISIDRKNAIYKAVRHLEESGHRRIMFIGDETDKLTGFTLGLLDFQMQYRPEWIITTAKQDAGTIAERLDRLLDLPALERPTALVVDSHGVLLRVLHVIRNRGLKIPQDLSLIVYDNIPEMEQLYDVPLTSVGPDINDLVMRSLDILTDDSLLLPGAGWREVGIESRITERASVRKL
ncbi:LacI family transcriptional regulator [Paenibacillus sp. J5C_2022]|uniref:LacI family DNA-binding transcriptional regulator n=1 Tax=Paenibacillus sp. J5C2022 TaxID=2977129 RepID=UPI0021CEE6CB|nr:LacI family DNA-binding transcriptional regulator [Paenibacillus sp. J5C2022]MCU6712801.1 LacI family transcriptional regulator [Paenibacillus sp. J5C2022]